VAAASADEARVCRFLLIIPAHPPATAQPRPARWTAIASLRAKNALATKNWFAVIELLLSVKARIAIVVRRSLMIWNGVIYCTPVVRDNLIVSVH
jgi:hypothetical protein